MTWIDSAPFPRFCPPPSPSAPLREAADWIDRFTRFWNMSLDRLDAHLAAVQAADRLDKKEH
jgi:hypothetical protein